MAAASIPGPLGLGQNHPAIDPETSAVTASPLPVSIGMGSGAATPVADKTSTVSDPAIEALDLAATARTAAYGLKKAHPAVEFTSGRRSKEDQARAMAGNVVKNRKWIEQTYASSTLRTRCQEWVDANTDKTTQAQIAEGLVSVFNTVADADLGKFSKHLSGEAFDVQPVDKDDEAIKKTIRDRRGMFRRPGY